MAFYNTNQRKLYANAPLDVINYIVKQKVVSASTYKLRIYSFPHTKAYFTKYGEIAAYLPTFALKLGQTSYYLEVKLIG